MFAGAGPIVLGNAPVIKKGPILPIGPGLAGPVHEDFFEEDLHGYGGKSAAVFVPKGSYYKKRAAAKK